MGIHNCPFPKPFPFFSFSPPLLPLPHPRFSLAPSLFFVEKKRQHVSLGKHRKGQQGSIIRTQFSLASLTHSGIPSRLDQVPFDFQGFLLRIRYLRKEGLRGRSRGHWNLPRSEKMTPQRIPSKTEEQGNLTENSEVSSNQGLFHHISTSSTQEWIKGFSRAHIDGKPQKQHAQVYLSQGKPFIFLLIFGPDQAKS